MDMCMVDYKVPNNMWKKYFCIKVHSTLNTSLTFSSLNLLIGTNKELKPWCQVNQEWITVWKWKL